MHQSGGHWTIQFKGDESDSDVTFDLADGDFMEQPAGTQSHFSHQSFGPVLQSCRWALTFRTVIVGKHKNGKIRMCCLTSLLIIFVRH